MISATGTEEVPTTFPEKELLSRNEVLQHNSKEDCWLIIGDSVYDLTEFISEHPGGSKILMSRAGEDATTYFVSKHGSHKGVQRKLERYKIGELLEEERLATDDFKDPFLMELVDRSYSEKLYNIPAFWKNRFFWIRTVNLVVFFSCSLWALYGNLPAWLCVILVFIQAIVGTSLFGLLAHEATHRNFPANKAGKFLLDISWTIFWPFIPQGPLRYEHNSHHIKIGDPEYDYEVAAFAPFIRYSALVTPSSMHRHQHRLAKYLYPFYANIITTVGGMRSTFWSRHNRKPNMEHIGFIVLTFLYYIIIPAFTGTNFFLLAGLYLVYQCTLFYGIYVGSAINHFVPNAANKIPDEYADNHPYYVCHNTTNFCLKNPFWFWYSGGFNVQIEHHLMPFVPVENLRRLTPLVQELCHKYDYPYKSYTSFIDLWNEHYDYLRTMATDQGGKGEEAIEIENKKRYTAR